MRIPSPGETALISAPTPYTTRPTRKQRLRPYLSLSLPAGIMSAAMTSRKRVIATWTPWTVVSRSSLMSLIITFMLEPAKLQMNCASASGSRARRNTVRDRSAASLPAMAYPLRSGPAERVGGTIGPARRPVPPCCPLHGAPAREGGGGPAQVRDVSAEPAVRPWGAGFISASSARIYVRWVNAGLEEWWGDD